MTHEETIAARAEVRRQLNDELELRDSRIREEKNNYERKKNDLNEAHALQIADINAAYRKRRLALIEQLDMLGRTPPADPDGLGENSDRIARQME